MNRRLGSADIVNTSPSEGLDLLFWDVYEDYEVVEPNEGPPYLIATPEEPTRRYSPLDDAPRLFLDFAKIAEQRDPEKALHQWITKYGLLGLSPMWYAAYGSLFRSQQQRPYTSEEDRRVRAGPLRSAGHRVAKPPLSYSTVGGPTETVEPYWNEVSRTNNLLTLYEAVLNQDAAAIENALTASYQLPPESEVLKPRNLDWKQIWKERHENSQQFWAQDEAGRDPETGERYVPRQMVTGGLIYFSLPDSWTAFLVDEALVRIWNAVNPPLSTFTYPAITSVTAEGPLTVDQLTNCLQPRNLIGAMYLQFYWIITSGHELPRCKQCRDIIPYALSPSRPGSGRKHKTHKNKQFCDDRCRQNYHYQNRVKPKRNGRETT